VRDRLDDRPFIANIVWPKTRQVTFQPDYLKTATPEELLLRAAHEGDLEVVMNLFGAVSAGNRPTEDELKKLLRIRVLEEAWRAVQSGGVHQDLPVLRHAIKIVVADEKAARRAEEGRGKAEAWSATAVNLTPGGSVLETAKTMSTIPAQMASGTAWLYLAPSQEAFKGSEVSDVSDVSNRLPFKDRLRNPDLSVSLPPGLRRPMSCDLATPNRCLTETVTA